MKKDKGEDAKRIVSKVITAVIVVAIVVIAAALCLTKLGIGKNGKEETTIITSSKLEKVLKISDLSSYKVTFNGVAKLMDDEGKQIGNVAYNAKVSVGFDMDQMTVDVEDVDEDKKNVVVTIPDIQIIDTEVDPGSLDYIFAKKKYDSDNISITALPQCRQDAEEECSGNEVLFELARENAANTIKALVNPLLESGDGYTLVIVDKEGNTYE